MSNKLHFPEGINLILKFLGAVVVGGRHLEGGFAYCEERELNDIKFQNWSWSLK